MHSINKILVAMFITVFSLGVMACDGDKNKTTSNPISKPVSTTTSTPPSP